MPAVSKDTIPMIKVKSSNLAEIGYDEYGAKLYVRFRNDGSRLYVYEIVPPIVWLGLLNCHSKGSYLRTQIIPFFRCRTLSQPFNPSKTDITAEERQ